MANSTVNLEINRVGKGGRSMHIPVDGGAHIRRGTLISLLAATAMAVPGSTAASTYAKGVALNEVDNTDGGDGDARVEIEYGEVFEYPTAGGADEITEATELFSIIYMYDDHTLADNDGGATRKEAGRFMGMSANGKVRVLVGPLEVGDSLADASAIDIADAGTFTAQTDVEGALQEIYQDIKSAHAVMPIPLTSFVDADGDPLAKFVSAGSPTFGFNLADSEAMNIRWNNDANPGTALCQVMLPPDLDGTAAMQLEFLCSKSGATVGDATTLTVTAFIIAPGDLHDADANAGAVSDALVGNAAAKTTKLLTVTIAAADIPDTTTTLSMTFTVTPTAGTLGTDDLMVHMVRLRYKRKALTS